MKFLTIKNYLTINCKSPFKYLQAKIILCMMASLVECERLLISVAYNVTKKMLFA